MKTTIYANYGLLAHEKQTVFSVVPRGEVYDKLTVDIPESLHPYVTAALEEVGIEPDNSYAALLSDSLTCRPGGKPAVRYVDRTGKIHIVALTIVE